MKSRLKPMAIALGATCLLAVFAQAKTQRSHGAHVHGDAKLSLVIDDKKASLEIELDGDSALGFEHEPKNKKEAEALASLIGKIEKDISKMVLFEARLNCVFKKKKLGMEPEGHDEHDSKEEKSSHHEQHSSLHADFEVACTNTISPSKLTVSLGKEFKKVKTIKVDLISGSNSDSFLVKDPIATLDLR